MLEPRTRPWRALVRDLAAQLLLWSGVSTPGRRARDRLVVVTFHRVLTEAQRREYPMPDLAVTPEELDFCLAFFTRHFACDTVSRALARLDAGARGPLLAVTFDDGQRDNFVNARPVLARYGVPATFYVVAGCLGGALPLWHDVVAYLVAAVADGRLPEGDAAVVRALLVRLGLDGEGDAAALAGQAVAALKRRDADETDALVAPLAAVARAAAGEVVPAWDGLMDQEALRGLVAEGHEIGAHSLSHALLPRCSDARLRRETHEARQVLEQALGRPVTSYCYPNGDHDARAVAAVAAAGYTSAVTTRFGLNGRGQARHALLRCDIQSATSRSRTGALSRARLALRLSGLQPGLRG